MYRVLVEGIAPGRRGLIVTCYVTGAHIGLCVERAVSLASVRFHLTDAFAAEVEPHAGRPPDDALEVVPRKLYHSRAVNDWPLRSDPLGFAPPKGVVATTGHETGDGDLHEGFTTEFHAPLWRTLCAVSQRRIEEIWSSLIFALPSADNIEVRLHPEHVTRRARVSVFLSPPLRERKEALALTVERRRNFFWNGFVELAVYCRSTRSPLRLDDHKVVAYYSESHEAQREIRKALVSLSIPSRRRLRTMAYRHHHYHYRCPGTPVASALIRALEDRGFKLVAREDAL